MTAFRFEGVALEWLQWTDDNLQFASWSDLCDEMLKRFGTSAFEIPTRRLSKLTQTGWVREYQNRFESMATKVTDVS